MNGPVYMLEPLRAFVRWRNGDDIAMRQFGPKSEDHPTVGKPCPACHKPFEVGDTTTLLPIGPGDDEEAQAKCRAGRYFNAVAIEMHWVCATGGEP